MTHRLVPALLATACVLAPMAIMPDRVNAQTVTLPAAELTLSIGRGQLITVPGTMADIFVANESVADVQVKSAHQLYLFGKGGGETSVYASDRAGQVIWSANIRVGANISTVDQMLQLAMPEAQIAVSGMGTNTFLLTGTVASPDDVAEAERLVGAYLGKDVNVISRLRTATPLQVNLQVRIAEVSRTLVREIGTNFLTRDQTGGFVFGASRGRDFATINSANGRTQFNFTPPTSGSAINLAGHLAGLDIASALDLGERIGLVTMLSQPNLTALSGETAEFLAGGEFPIPMSQGLGTTAIEYRKYGVSLSYTPTVLANGRIALRVRPEVSELSTEGAVTLAGTSIPALTVRRAETTVELGSGQSFMIAGLMRNNSQNAIDKTPGMGDLPILGSLFRSTAYRRGETELVIVVTPYLVKPVDARDIKLPTDGYRVPNELQRLLGGLEGDGVSGTARPGPERAPDLTPLAPDQAPKVGLAPDAADANVAAPAKSRGRKRDMTSHSGSRL